MCGCVSICMCVYSHIIEQYFFNIKILSLKNFNINLKRKYFTI